MAKVSEKEPLISVIIPVYNVEKYLDRCVDSVVNQTYKNLEIILVDDGSPDKCPQMCDDWAKKDKRIKVIHKENGGLSDARNCALDVMKGQYVCFVDSDDYVKLNYVEFLYNLLKKYNTKISVADNLMIYGTGRQVNISNYEEYVATPEGFFEKMLWGDRDLDNGAWTKLYLSSLFEGIRYPVGKLYEDTATTFKLIDKCDRIAVKSEPIYYYMIRKDSITQCSFNNRKLEIIEATKILTNYIRNKYPKLEDACVRKITWAYLSTLSQIAMSNYDNKDVINNLRNEVLKNKKCIMDSSKAQKRDKLGIFCLNVGYRFYKVVWRIYQKVRRKY